MARASLLNILAITGGEIRCVELSELVEPSESSMGDASIPHRIKSLKHLYALIKYGLAPEEVLKEHRLS